MPSSTADSGLAGLRSLAEDIFDAQVQEDVSQSKTAKAMLDQLGSLPGFKWVSDEAWLVIGKTLKPLKLHTSVFTGALVALVRYMSAGGKFPATPAWLSSKGLKTPRYESQRTQSILNSDQLLEPLRLSAFEALESKWIQRTKEDEETWRNSEKSRVMVWTLGENANKMKSVLRLGGVKIQESAFYAGSKALLETV